MRQIKKPIVTLTLFLFVFVSALAQEEQIEIVNDTDYTYNEAMELMFGQLDHNKIPTGILKERSVLIQDWTNFDGELVISVATRDSILELYSELYFAHFNRDTLIDVFDQDSTINAYIKLNEVTPIALLHYTYQQFKPNVIDSNLIAVQDSFILLDVSLSGQTPYENKVLFSMAPVADFVGSGSTTFNLASEFIFSNVSGSYDKIEANFNNGQGYIRIFPDEPFILVPQDMQVFQI